MRLLRQRAVRVALDVGLLVGFVAEFLAREGPNYSLHSWIGVTLVPVISIHLASNWRWVTSTYRRRRAHPEWRLARFNAAFSAITMVCILSGLPIWLEWSDSGAWTVAHNITGLFSIVLALSHLWRNRHRLVALVDRRAEAPSVPAPLRRPSGGVRRSTPAASITRRRRST